jgi:hypothetical protein
VAGEPMFSRSQLARALVAAAQAGIPGVIGLNKTNLLAATSARERLTPYRAMSAPVLEQAIKARPDLSAPPRCWGLHGPAAGVAGGMARGAGLCVLPNRSPWIPWAPSASWSANAPVRIEAGRTSFVEKNAAVFSDLRHASRKALESSIFARWAGSPIPIGNGSLHIRNDAFGSMKSVRSTSDPIDV